MGAVDSLSDLGAVRNAAGESGAHDYIRTFESYYQTRLREEATHDDSQLDSHYINRYINPKSKKEVPFLRKILIDKPHAQAKCRGQLIDWSPKPKKKGFDTKIPKAKSVAVEEDFNNRALSGGQWQRIALARAFMRMRDADLLILDEPSSALDPQAEYQVFKSIMDLRKDKTTIYIVFP